MAASEVIVERLDRVAVVTLNRPESLNALSNDLLSLLLAALENLSEAEEVRTVVITGGPSVFAAGADLKQLAEQLGTEATLTAFLQARFRLWERLRGLQKPLIAAVSGYALGAGCELALACDLIVASESARFGQPEVNLGLLPGAGGTQRMARALGKARAMEVVLTGRMLTAYEAQRLGLVNRVVPVELLKEEAVALAQEIAAKPPIAARVARTAVLKAFETTLEDGLEYERQSLTELLATEDAQEGIRAFIERRPPTYRGR